MLQLSQNITLLAVGGIYTGSKTLDTQIGIIPAVWWAPSVDGMWVTGWNLAVPLLVFLEELVFRLQVKPEFSF